MHISHHHPPSSLTRIPTKRDTAQASNYLMGGHCCELCSSRTISMVCPLIRNTAINGVLEITSSRVPGLRPGRPEIGGVPTSASTWRSICSSWLMAARGFCCAINSSCWNRLALALESHLMGFKRLPGLAGAKLPGVWRSQLSPSRWRSRQLLDRRPL